MNKIKVLVVDDSAFMRRLITDFLSEHPQIEVIGTARNGKDALEKIPSLQPDVITMDVEMPMMNGLEALKQIMERSPLPVVMLSSTTKEGAENTILAMQYGAVDFVAKPSGNISLDLYKVKEELVDKVMLASRANLRLINKRATNQTTASSQKISYSKIEVQPSEKGHEKKIICIGTSTGGPRALQQVLTQLPKQIPAPIVIVQHMPKGFTKSLAQRLDSLCDISVREVEHLEELKQGVAYIAPGGAHFTVASSGQSLIAHLDYSPPRNGHRPSVDVLFESVSALSGYSKIAVIMTGMGSDGTNGLKRLKEAGETKAIAESEETAVVFGMPKSAIAANLVDDVVPLEGIAETIMKYAGRQGV
ncbi:chemotaxis response regulator protein-glutamate methylesterase [Anoxybacteroides tepidamans]|uniref:protein-glutamate methylesterase/protein-glutamine glutaminase n=1 Tax=Anoxybacteroides tepidamans TaxID=265948 RepID=UPI0004848AC5|nr:chemotaxis response regulator protein-glutamate methylesterase [Anoxybacillus tepidamans]